MAHYGAKRSTLIAFPTYLWYEHEIQYNVVRYLVMEIQHGISNSVVGHNKAKTSQKLLEDLQA